MKTETQAPTAVTSELPVRAKAPFSIDICESSAKAFQLASALIRQGYVILEDRPVNVYPHGVAVFTCVLGNPTESGYADAEAAKRLGLELEAAEFEKRVQYEVEIRIQRIKAAEHEARKAALVAEHQKKIREIETTAAAEIAKLK